MRLLPSLFLAIPACISALYIAYYIKTKWYESQKQGCRSVRRFEALFKSYIRKVFINQCTSTFSTIRVQSVRALNRNNSEPLLLVFLATPGTRNTALTLAKRLAQITVWSLEIESKSWSEMDSLILSGKLFANNSSPWHFYETIKEKLSQNRILIITNFEFVHPHSAAVLTYLSKELFFPIAEAFIYLVVEIPEEESINVAYALNAWVNAKLTPYFESNILQEMLRGLYLRTCLIKNDDAQLMKIK